MTRKDLERHLKRLRACKEAQEWVRAAKGTAAELWARCSQADWMLWLAATLGVPRPFLALASCSCARTALQYVPGGEDRPRLAIQTTERWAWGDFVTWEELDSAKRAAEQASYGYACGGFGFGFSSSLTAISASFASQVAITPLPDLAITVSGAASYAVRAALAGWPNLPSSCKARFLTAKIVRDYITWDEIASAMGAR